MVKICQNYTRPVNMAITYLPLAVAQLFFLCLMPLYFFSLVAEGGQLQQLPTQFYFDFTQSSGASRPSTGIYPTAYDLNELFIRESDTVMFVTMGIAEKLQVYEMCDNGTTTVLDWCERNSSNTILDLTQTFQENLLIVARIECYGNKLGSLPGSASAALGGVFSNYNRNDVAQQTQWALQLGSILDRAKSKGNVLCPGCGPADFAAKFPQGLDIVITYNWNCNLGHYDPNLADRYLCAVDTLTTNVEVLSSTSLITLPTFTRNAEIIDPNGAQARLVTTNTGFRLRFRGTGGCTLVTLQSIMAMFAASFAINGLAAVLLGILSSIFLHRAGLEEAELVVKRVGGPDGPWGIHMPENTVVSDASVELSKRASLSQARDKQSGMKLGTYVD